MTERSFGWQRGFSLVEILVTLVIVMIGLLGLAGVQMRAHQAEMESYQRAQALILVTDMVDRINANRKVRNCYKLTSANNIVLGTSSPALPACAGGLKEQQDLADADLVEWDNLLKGSAEGIDTNGNNVLEAGESMGAMLGARGCITEDAVTGLFKVSVAWQGIAKTAAPTEADANATCGQNLYGDETLRREVSAQIRFATLK